MGPNYKAPEKEICETWASDGVSTEAVTVAWWEQFEDPLLSKYMRTAQECNHDVLTATSNILQARALRQIVASSFFPQLSADVSAIKTYFSKNGPVFAIGPSVGSVPGTVSSTTGLPFSLQIPQIQNLYNALIDASWEVDIFGKTRRAVEAANAEIGSAIESRNDTLISVLAEIGSNYMELRSSQAQEKLVIENIALLEKKSFLVRKQLEAGYINRTDDETIQAMLASEKSQLPNIKAEIYRNIYAISVLTGSMPEVLISELSSSKPLPRPPENIAIGLRSDLLRRRPDIRKAERDLARATANIGVAVASFFPTITLIGDGGLQSLMIKNLFSSGSRTWAVGGDFNMPIFQGGRLMGNLKAKKAETAAKAHQYQQVVLNAFQEAESAVISYIQDVKVSRERGHVVDRYEEVVRLSKEKHLKGLVSLLNLLDAERQLNEALQALLNSNRTQLLNLVFLYKALGGGWECILPNE